MPVTLANVVTSPQLEAEQPYVDSLYVPDNGGTILVAPRVADVLSRFLALEWSTGRIDRERAEAWPLTMVASVMESLLHSVVHAVPGREESQAAGRAESSEWWVWPSGAAWDEGLAELTAQTLSTRFLEETGFLAMDARLASKHSVRRRLPLQVQAVRQMLTMLAEGAGTSLEQELSLVLTNGLGRDSLWSAASRAARLYSAGSSAIHGVKIPMLHALPPVLGVFDGVLSEVTQAWSAGGVGETSMYENELEAGSKLGVRAVEDAERALGRVAAQMKGMPDLALLGKGIADAATAASRSVEARLDDVWAQLESMTLMGG